MNTQQLSEIKERLEKTTKGPWVWKKSNKYAEDSIVSVAGVTDDMPWPIDVLQGGCGQNTGFLDYENDYDMEFIAHARQDVPELIAEVERLNKALSQFVNKKGS